MSIYLKKGIDRFNKNAEDFYSVNHSKTMIEIDKALQYKLDDLLNDDYYNTVKKDEEEIRAIIFYCYMKTKLCQFEKEYIYKYSKVLNNKDRKKLMKCLMDTLNMIVEKYRNNYPLTSTERKENMFDIINSFGLLIMSIELILKAAKEHNDITTCDLVNIDIYNSVKSMLVFHDKGFNYKLKEL